jgi:cytochrome b involved in lipid metabolism
MTLSKITMVELKKHNTINDGWIVYKSKVYDVTTYIKKHPGALAIKKGLGKDATNLFDKEGHSERAKNIMKKYLIGKLEK